MIAFYSRTNLLLSPWVAGSGWCRLQGSCLSRTCWSAAPRRSPWRCGGGWRCLRVACGRWYQDQQSLVWVAEISFYLSSPIHPCWGGWGRRASWSRTPAGASPWTHASAQTSHSNKLQVNYCTIPWCASLVLHHPQLCKFSIAASPTHLLLCKFRIASSPTMLA